MRESTEKAMMKGREDTEEIDTIGATVAVEGHIIMKGGIEEKGTAVTDMKGATIMNIEVMEEVTEEVMEEVTEEVIGITDKIVTVEITDRMKEMTGTITGLKADRRRRRRSVLCQNRKGVMRSHQWTEESLVNVLELSLQGIMNLLEVVK